MRRAAVACCTVLLATLLCASAQAAPSLSAPAAILVERDLGGTVVYARNASQERPIASTTKMMTAYVVLEHASLRRVLTVQPYAAGPGESLAGIRAGERLTVADLLRAMLLPSGNDAAHTLAVDIGGSTGAFVGMMNAAAARLHLGRTHYSTPVGLDAPGNYSTATDLARLAGALMGNRFFAETVARTSATLADGRRVHNRDTLVGRYGFVVGIKTGHTSAAGWCLVGAGRRGGVNLISVVLGTPSESARNADTLALLRYGFATYHRLVPVHAGHVYARVAPLGHPDQRVELVPAHGASLIVRRGTKLSVYLNNVPATLTGPLPAGSAAGEIDVRLDGRLAATVPLVTRTAVPAAGSYCGPALASLGGLPQALGVASSAC